MAGDIEKIVKQRILNSLYWKQHCFGINAVGICDRAADVTSIGGLYANQRPLPFLCLLYKLLLISPAREIIEEFLHQKYFKYLTALAAVYIRLSYDAKTIHTLLEPLLADYRKLRMVNQYGKEELWFIDELVDKLLNEERVFNLVMPHMPPRERLEDFGLEMRQPLIDEADIY